MTMTVHMHKGTDIVVGHGWCFGKLCLLPVPSQKDSQDFVWGKTVRAQWLNDSKETARRQSPLPSHWALGPGTFLRVLVRYEDGRRGGDHVEIFPMKQMEIRLDITFFGT